MFDDFSGGTPVETDPTRAIEWMIGLPAVRFLGCGDGDDDEARIHVETKASSVGRPSCGVLAREKDRPCVEVVDLPMFGRPARLVWHKRRFVCADADCAKGSWTEEDGRIAAPRQVLTARAAKWATFQVGRRARSVNEVAHELGCEPETTLRGERSVTVHKSLLVVWVCERCVNSSTLPRRLSSSGDSPRQHSIRGQNT